MPDRITSDIPMEVRNRIYRMCFETLEWSDEPYFTAMDNVMRLVFEGHRQPEDEGVVTYIRNRVAARDGDGGGDGGCESALERYADAVLGECADMLEPYAGDKTVDEIVAICRHPDDFYAYCTMVTSRM